MASVSESKGTESNVGNEEPIAVKQNGVDAAQAPVANDSEKAGSSTQGNGTVKRFGKVKWFNVTKGWGFIAAADGGQDVFVHQSVIRMEGFRSLAEGEGVEFEARQSEKGLEATIVTGPDGNPCLGSNRHPAAKKKYRKARCYNCGEFANHVAARCDKGVMPKRCHNCRSEEHLIKDCPLKAQKQNGHPEETESAGADGVNNGVEAVTNNQAATPELESAPAPSAANEEPADAAQETKKTVKAPKKK